MTSPVHLSGLTEAQLRDCLGQVRRVAALPDGEALPALDGLLFAMQQETTSELSDAGWDASLVADQMAGLIAMIERTEQIPDDALKGWEGEQLRQRCGLLGKNQPEIHRRAEHVARATDVRFASHRLDTLSREPLATSSGLPRRLALVDQAFVILRRLRALSPEGEGQARAALPLAAQYRAQKRLDEAAVVAAGGNELRAARLRKESQVLWAQDFARCFPGEAPIPL